MPDGDALEVATVANQVALESWYGKELLGKLAQHHPAMLDLLLGMLFKFRPVTVHAIDMPDIFAGGEPRRILWDDETGDVSGEHHDVPELREALARAERDGRLQDFMGYWPLRDPRRDPRDFLVVLGVQHYGGQPDWLPPSLRGVEPAPFVKAELPPGAVA